MQLAGSMDLNHAGTKDSENAASQQHTFILMKKGWQEEEGSSKNQGSSPACARLQVHSSAVTEVVSLHVTMCTPEVLANLCSTSSLASLACQNSNDEKAILFLTQQLAHMVVVGPGG